MTVHLSIVLFWPLAFGLIGAALPRRLGPAAALVGALVPLGYAAILVADFDASKAGLQYVTDDAWIDELGIRYKLGVDGVNLFLVALTALLFAASALWVVFRPYEGSKLFAFHFGLAETAVLGALLAQDLALFVLFFDLMLVPIYFLVGQWGGPERIAATIKLVIYTLVGSLLMLAAAVATAVTAKPADEPLAFPFSTLAERPLEADAQNWIFLAFALAFLIKMPAFPLHGWMPDAYRNMPLPVLAVFSGVISKVAAYGFLRIVLPLFPDATVRFQELILLLALASVLYGSVMAFTQTDVRLVLGYSSMAQLGFITLGVFALQPEGAQGAILQMVNHGLVVAPLIFIVILLGERAAGSMDLRDMGGIAFRGPVLAGLFLVVALATLAMPGSANFVGEFLILLGLFESKLVFAILAFTGVALASVYMLRAYIRAVHNRPGPEVTSRDLDRRDGLVLVPLVAAIIAFGVYPQFALEKGEDGVEASVRPAQLVANPPAQPAQAPSPDQPPPGVAP